MNRITIVILSLIVSIGGKAQTDFRPISYQEALQTARTEGRKVFMDFYTDWCGPCKMMARDVFPQKQVGEYFNSKFVCIKVNAEKGEGVELAKRYKVNAYPTFIVIDPTEKELGRTVGGRVADAFVAEVERMMNPELTPDRIKARYASGERNPQLVQAYVTLLKEERRGGRAGSRQEYIQQRDELNRIVQDYFMGLSDHDRLSKDNLFVYRSYTASTDEASARYLIAQRNRFAPPLRGEVDSIISKLYKADINALLADVLPYDAKRVKTLKEEVGKLGLNKDKSYDTTFRLINMEAGPVNRFIPVMEKLFLALDLDQQGALMDGLTYKFAKADQTVKNRLARVVRQQLPDMDFSLLFTAIDIIRTLEGNKNSH